jgi:hypothetical protein
MTPHPQHSQESFATASEILELDDQVALNYIQGLVVDLDQNEPSHPQFEMSSSEAGLLQLRPFQNSIPATYNQTMHGAQEIEATPRTSISVMPYQSAQSVETDPEIVHIRTQPIRSGPTGPHMYSQAGVGNISDPEHLQEVSPRMLSTRFRRPVFQAQHSHQAMPPKGPHQQSMQVHPQQPSSKPIIQNQHSLAAPGTQQPVGRLQSHGEFHPGYTQLVTPVSSYRIVGNLVIDLRSPSLVTDEPPNSAAKSTGKLGTPSPSGISKQSLAPMGLKKSISLDRKHQIHQAEHHEQPKAEESIQSLEAKSKRNYSEFPEQAPPTKRVRFGEMPSKSQAQDRVTQQSSLQQHPKVSQGNFKRAMNNNNAVKLSQQSPVVVTLPQSLSPRKRDRPVSADQDSTAKRAKLAAAPPKLQPPLGRPQQLRARASEQIPFNGPEGSSLQPSTSGKRDRSMSPEQDFLAKRAHSNDIPQKPKMQQKRPRKVVGRASGQSSSKKPETNIPKATKSSVQMPGSSTQSQVRSQQPSTLQETQTISETSLAQELREAHRNKEKDIQIGKEPRAKYTAAAARDAHIRTAQLLETIDEESTNADLPTARYESCAAVSKMLRNLDPVPKHSYVSLAEISNVIIIPSTPLWPEEYIPGSTG